VNTAIAKTPITTSFSYRCMDSHTKIPRTIASCFELNMIAAYSQVRKTFTMVA